MGKSCARCECPFDTIVYASAAHAYQVAGDFDNSDLEGLDEILNGAGGYLDLYNNPVNSCSKKCGRRCGSQLNAQVFAAAISSGTTAWLMMPSTDDTGIAGQAFAAVNSLLGLYLNYKNKGDKCKTDCCDNVCSVSAALEYFTTPYLSNNIPTMNSQWCLGKQTPAEVFLTAFSQIYKILLTADGDADEINLAALTAVVHYLQVQLCITTPEPYPISSYTGD